MSVFEMKQLTKDYQADPAVVKDIDNIYYKCKRPGSPRYPDEEQRQHIGTIYDNVAKIYEQMRNNIYEKRRRSFTAQEKEKRPAGRRVVLVIEEDGDYHGKHALDDGKI